MHFSTSEIDVQYALKHFEDVVLAYLVRHKAIAALYLWAYKRER